jgi:2-polyprenyl-3-methyl-5-hydroxy-6-metoxy-1,4-benzoquinol methylase
LAIVPASVRKFLILGLLVTESRIGGPKDSLKRLFSILDDLDALISERATALEGGGEHPKHRLTRYHDFFVARIPAHARVLDLGCGYGAVARSIARRVEGVEVTGIDNHAERIAEARAADNPANLAFVLGDALADLPAGGWDTVVLSNILEHIEARVEFLRQIQDAVAPRQFLIRVPLFERNWQVPMRREIGANYFSDPTHFIEHGLEEFDAEMAAAGLEVTERLTLWGEIWAQCRPSAQA